MFDGVVDIWHLATDHVSWVRIMCGASLFFPSLYQFGSLETAITRLYTHFTDHNTDKPLSISARNIMKLCARFHKSTEGIGVFFSLNMTTAFQNKSIQCFSVSLCIYFTRSLPTLGYKMVDICIFAQHSAKQINIRHQIGWHCLGLCRRYL